MDRIHNLQSLIPDDSTAFLIISENNRFYFTHFRSSDGYLIVKKDTVLFLTDFRYIENARKVIDSEITTVMISSVMKALDDICRDFGIKTLVIEEDHIQLSAYERLRSSVHAEISGSFSLSEKILEMRMIKSDDEIEKIITAQKISEKAYLETLNILKPGITERDVAAYLEYRMKLSGAEKVSFDLITITGKNTSLPHGVPGDTKVKEGDLFTFDIGCIYDGYCSDMTRTIAIGHCSDRQRMIYDTVLEAHKKAFDIIRPGIRVSQVDLAAREYIEIRGYGKNFGHATGHGVGLDIHEKPSVSKNSNIILKSNMVITDEPGIYLENEFGVRIEDMCRVTDNGAESLASVDKELFILN